ncbi:hypothetical protein EMN47_03890 [Prolixibacteraceae bacterium JC049]|nr:hypothetical protein [Prolixibacteraceae bacterium JC049]
MIKAIIYKEWLKTRYFVAFIVLVGLAIHIYSFLTIGHSFRNTGRAELWDLIVNRSHFIFPSLKYFPLFAGLLIGVTQMVPEMVDKRLKLTMHLPVREKTMTTYLIAYGLILLTTVFILFNVVLATFLHLNFAWEITATTLSTTLVWYLSGLAAYLLSVFCITEPTWKRRIPNILLSLLLLHFFFITDYPAAYGYFTFGLVLLILIYSTFIYNSIHRFKTGYQD